MTKHQDNSATSARQQNITVTTPYGTLQIEDAAAASDHVGMNIDRLEAFLIMISGEGHQAFATLNEQLQQSLLWGVQLAATEIVQILKQVQIVAKPGARK